ncbi:MAG: hypothetical protein V4489_07560, partial [Chlamydiota bacterium]
ICEEELEFVEDATQTSSSSSGDLPISRTEKRPSSQNVDNSSKKNRIDNTERTSSGVTPSPISPSRFPSRSQDSVFLEADFLNNLENLSDWPDFF